MDVIPEGATLTVKLKVKRRVVDNGVYPHDELRFRIALDELAQNQTLEIVSVTTDKPIEKLEPSLY